MNTLLLTSDAEGAVPALQEAIDRLDTAEGELVLDFSAVQRIDPQALGVLEKLSSCAEKKSVKVVLCGVNIGVYKVLKLVRLDTRFAFRT
jgi:anti-anti-sigma factor